MKGLQDLLQLGNPTLYEVSEPVRQAELEDVSSWVKDLHNVMAEIRRVYQFGRAIAAPQLEIMKRLIYMNIDEPLILINPEIIDRSEETFGLWDDCMCFPNLLVKVRRHQRITIRFRDQHWNSQEWQVEGDLSELLQHEYDHLEGILCTMRAIDNQSFRWRG
jgi:peptide deformylase